MKIQIKKNSKFTRIDRWPHFINVSIRISCVLCFFLRKKSMNIDENQRD